MIGGNDAFGFFKKKLLPAAYKTKVLEDSKAAVELFVKKEEAAKPQEAGEIFNYTFANKTAELQKQSGEYGQ